MVEVNIFINFIVCLCSQQLWIRHFTYTILPSGRETHNQSFSSAHILTWHLECDCNELNYKRERGVQIMGLIGIGGLLLLGGIYLVFAFIWWLLQIIANWNIFTKPVKQDGKVSFLYTAITFFTKIACGHPISGLFLFSESSNWEWRRSEWNQYHNPCPLSSLIRIIPAIISIPYCIKLSRAFGHGIGLRSVWYSATNLYANSWILAMIHTMEQTDNLETIYKKNSPRKISVGNLFIFGIIFFTTTIPNAIIECFEYKYFAIQIIKSSKGF